MTTLGGLSAGELDALVVLGRGMASRAVSTVDDPGRGLRGVNGRAANQLIARGLARDVHQWHAVEITDHGRAVLGGVG